MSIATKPVTTVVIVGGSKSNVASLGAHFDTIGGPRIVSHIADVTGKGKKRNIRVSSLAAADGVIALTDTISHGAWDTVRGLATKAGIPWIGVPSKWSVAEPVLRQHGFIPPREADAEDTSSIYEWAWDMLEERPERILDLDGLTKRVASDMKLSDLYPDVIDTVAADFWKRCRSLQGPNLTWRNNLMVKWLERVFFAPYKNGDKAWPLRSAVKVQSDLVFRVHLASDLIIQARVAIFGEWSRDLIRQKQAHTHFQASVPESTMPVEMFHDLLKTGVIKSFIANHMTYTSTMAVDIYVKENREFLEEGMTPPADLEPAQRNPVNAPIAGAAAEVGSNVSIGVSQRTKDVAEEVGLEMATLFGDMIDKRLTKMTDHIQDTFKTQIDELKKGLGESTKTLLKRMDFLAGLIGESRDSQATSANTVVTQVCNDVEVLMGQVDVQHAGLRSAIRDLETRVIKATAKTPETTAPSGALSLREIGLVAKETGLKISIQAGGPIS